MRIYSLLSFLIFIMLFSSCKKESLSIVKNKEVEKITLIGEVLNLKEHNLEQVGSIPLNFSKDLVIVDFWATWCAPCIEGFPKLERIQKKYPNIQIVAISNETSKKVKSFLNKKDFKIPFYTNTNKSLFKKLDVKTLPTTIILDKKNKFIWAGNSNSTDLDVLLSQYFNTNRIPKKFINKEPSLTEKYYKNDSILRDTKDFEYYITKSNPNDRYFALTQKNIYDPINIKYSAVPIIEIISDLKNINYQRLIYDRLELDTIRINLFAKSSYKGLIFKDFSKNILSNIESIYDIKITEEEKVVKTLQINITNNEVLNLSIENSKGGGMAKIENKKVKISRLTLTQLASYLESKTKIPFTVKKEKENKYNFEFDSEILSNQAILKKELNRYGIQINNVNKKMRMVYIK